MVAFSEVAKVATVLHKYLQLSKVKDPGDALSMAQAEIVAATFDEYDAAKLMEIDQAAEATPLPGKAKAFADAQKAIRGLIEGARQRSPAA